MRPNARHSTSRIVTRRRAVAGLGGLATAGVGVLAIAPDPARAQVSVDTFDVTGGEFTAASITPVADVTIGYDYDVGQEAISELRFALTINDTEVATESLTTQATQLSGETELSARVTESEAWSASDFEVAVGESVSHDVTVGVAFEVRDSGGVLVSDTAEDTATVTVSHPQANTWTATVGGSGVIRTETDN
jgi:hypothetical protein